MPTVLISGAGVAGFVLAHWLGRAGFDTTVVELAPTLRTGGNAVDFRGPLHRSILERMGILADLERVRTGGTAMRFVDEHSRRLMELPADFAGGDIEVLRGDLARVLYEHGRATAEFRFGDSITALDETADGVDVTFTGGTRGRFDLVVGADGVHSGCDGSCSAPSRGMCATSATTSPPGACRTISACRTARRCCTTCRGAWRASAATTATRRGPARSWRSRPPAGLRPARRRGAEGDPP